MTFCQALQEPGASNWGPAALGATPALSPYTRPAASACSSCGTGKWSHLKWLCRFCSLLLLSHCSPAESHHHLPCACVLFPGALTAPGLGRAVPSLAWGSSWFLCSTAFVTQFLLQNSPLRSCLLPCQPTPPLSGTLQCLCSLPPRFLVLTRCPGYRVRMSSPGPAALLAWHPGCPRAWEDC